MNEPVWVRELTATESGVPGTARTGDTLPDGSILIRPEDIDRMGLRALRSLIQQKVLREKATLSVPSQPGDSGVHTLLDEEF